MTLLTALAVAIAGGLGAMLRYLADNALPASVRARFPWGTALVNITGSFALGILSGLASHGLPDFWTDVLGVGIVGGYTTFSTASVETVRLGLARRHWSTVLNGIGVLVLCVTVAGTGYAAAVA